MNIFSELPNALEAEQFEDIVKSPNCRIERIVTDGQTSPKDFWYDQDESEFIVLLQGKARLQFEDGFRDLKKGDTLIIPRRQKHRVDWVSKDELCLWLAVFYRE